MELLTLLAFGLVIWVAFKVVFKDSAQTIEQKKIRDEKYGNRQIDKSLSLFERNRDIIDIFYGKTNFNSHQRYEMDNKIRDCLNEICLAENQMPVAPGSKWLSSWMPYAPTAWRILAKDIEKYFGERKRQEDRAIRKMQIEIDMQKETLKASLRQVDNPIRKQNLSKRSNDSGSINIKILREILTINDVDWITEEKDLIRNNGSYREFPLLGEEASLAEGEALNREIREYNSLLEKNVPLHQKNKEYFSNILAGYKNMNKDEVEKRMDYVINWIQLPSRIPKTWQLNFDVDEAILVVDLKLPDVVHATILKDVKLKSGTVEKQLNKKELSELVPRFHPAIILRYAYEIFRNDQEKKLKLLVLNGWVEFDDPATGRNKKTYTSSIALTRDQIIEMNLEKIDPIAAFISLKGKSAGKLVDIIPIVPVLSLNRKDSRFIETKAVLGALGSETNLAAMDWQDFESLIAELFERVFQKEGVEIKVTQASRDRGVDAVVFDPDPIKGGKFVIQAKRYTHTVDVSAVRDLCAVVKKEGASRGILVTTSSYGSDAYAFASNEPITLLNGNELLGLLQEHGYKFKIDLKEARKLNASN